MLQCFFYVSTFNTYLFNDLFICVFLKSLHLLYRTVHRSAKWDLRIDIFYNVCLISAFRAGVEFKMIAKLHHIRLFIYYSEINNFYLNWLTY